MDRAALVREQAGRRKHTRAGEEPADRHAAIVFLSSQANAAVVVGFDVEAAADDDHVRPVGTGDLAPFVVERRVDGASTPLEAFTGRPSLLASRHL